jgi:hypothetical protein
VTTRPQRRPHTSIYNVIVRAAWYRYNLRSYCACIETGLMLRTLFVPVVQQLHRVGTAAESVVSITLPSTRPAQTRNTSHLWFICKNLSFLDSCQSLYFQDVLPVHFTFFCTFRYILNLCCSHSLFSFLRPQRLSRTPHETHFC